MPSFARHPLGLLVVTALLLAGAPAVHIDAWSAATPAPTPWGACPINGREEAKDKLAAPVSARRAP
jgi:hypothetical protein